MDEALIYECEKERRKARESRPVRMATIRRSWQNTWMLGVSVCWSDSVCVMVHVGPWVLILGPHFSA